MQMRERFVGLWCHADFLKFWTGQTISLFGSEFTTLAFPLVAILTLNASPIQVGLLVAISTLPWLLIGLFVGVGVDHWHRRPILITADLGRAVLLGSIPVAAFLGILHIEHLYAVAFLVGVLTVCFDTAYQSYLPSLVEREHLIEGNGKLSISLSAAQIAAPGIVGTMIQAFTAPAAIIVDALSFLFSALTIGMIRKKEPTVISDRQGIWIALREGVSYIRRHSLLRAFAGSNATFVFFMGMTQAVLLLFFTRQLHLSPKSIGLIFGAGSLGGLLGATAAGTLGRLLKLGPTIMGTSFLRGFGIFCVPLAAVLPAGVMPLLIVSRVIHSFGWSVYAVNQQSVRQSLVPDRLQGRVAGSFLFLVRGATPLGAAIGGVLGGWLGVVPTLVIGGTGLLLPVIWLAVSPLWSLHKQPMPLDDVPFPAVPQ